MFDSKRFLKRFSLQAAAVLATVGAATFAEPVFANEVTSPVTTTAGTPTTTVDAEELTVQITAVTLLEERTATFQAYAENFETELPVAREELDKTKTNLETTYSNPAATETEKLSASMAHSFATAYYEGVAEAGSHFKDLAGTTTQAKDNLLQQAPNLEQEIEVLPTEQKLEVYRAIRQTIEHEMDLIDSERQAAQELVDQAKEAIRTADLDMPLDDYRELIKHLARVTAWSNLPELTYDYSVIDAEIKALEDLLAQEAGQDNGDQDDTDNGSDTTGGSDQGGADTGSDNGNQPDTGDQGDADTGSDQGGTDTGSDNTTVPTSPLVSPANIALLVTTEKPAITPTLPITLALNEVLSKVAGASTVQDISAIINAYWVNATIAVTRPIMETSYTQSEELVKKVSQELAIKREQTTDSEAQLLIDLQKEIEAGYLIRHLMARDLYRTTQMTVEENQTLLNGYANTSTATLSAEKEVELLNKIRQELTKQLERSVATNNRLPKIREDFATTLTDANSTKEELAIDAHQYGQAQFFFAPRYTYDFTELDSRIATLTKPQGNDTAPGTSNQGQQNPGQDQSGNMDKTDKTNQTNQNDNTKQTDGVKKPLVGSSETTSVSQPVASRQDKTLPNTGEGSSTMLSALGLMSLVTSVGLIVKKRQD